MVTTPNAELAYKVLDHIDAHPDSWDQSSWVCGTTACFAGWAVRLSGATIDGQGGSDGEVVDGPPELVGLTVEEAAYEALGIDVETSGWTVASYTEWLFHDRHTRNDLGRRVAEIFGPRPAATS